ncbi:MAG: hypothetical protein BGO05_05280 [Rhizobiales bacterium 63-7]|nr:hypothetical protein [Hyphomicrobiales bacterium]OJU66617.1 MAG: hypothetical protein BGO05_05280 [Rhizobiales bacterium 63-7]
MISQVTIKISQNGESRDVWFLFASNHPNLFELNEDLVADGTVYGHRIETEHAGPGRRRETRRYECILHRDTIVSVIPSQHELV